MRVFEFWPEAMLKSMFVNITLSIWSSVSMYYWQKKMVYIYNHVVYKTINI